jgi:hypothetical protein
MRMFNRKIGIARRRALRRPARGTAAVEFAVIAPLMMLFTYGLVEIGNFMMVKSQAVQATREGARLAVCPTAQSTEVIAKVEESLQLLAITDADIELIPIALASAAPGDLVTVRVRINPSSIAWIPGFLDDTMPDIVVETVMRRETTN